MARPRLPPYRRHPRPAGALGARRRIGPLDAARGMYFGRFRGRDGFRERLVGVAVHEVGNHGIVEDPGDDPFGDAVTGNLDDAVEILLVDELRRQDELFGLVLVGKALAVAGIPGAHLAGSHDLDHFPLPDGLGQEIRRVGVVEPQDEIRVEVVVEGPPVGPAVDVLDAPERPVGFVPLGRSSFERAWSDHVIHSGWVLELLTKEVAHCIIIRTAPGSPASILYNFCTRSNAQVQAVGKQRKELPTPDKCRAMVIAYISM